MACESGPLPTGFARIPPKLFVSYPYDMSPSSRQKQLNASHGVIYRTTACVMVYSAGSGGERERDVQFRDVGSSYLAGFRGE